MALDGDKWSTPRARTLYLRERNSITFVQKSGWTPGSVWRGAVNHPSTTIRSSNSPADGSESLYRLSYPGPQVVLLHVSLGAHSWTTIHWEDIAWQKTPCHMASNVRFFFFFLQSEPFQITSCLNWCKRRWTANRTSNKILWLCWNSGAMFYKHVVQVNAGCELALKTEMTKILLLLRCDKCA